MNSYSKSTNKRNGDEKKQSSIKLKKNETEMFNEVTKVSQAPSFVPNSYGDRFIPRRYNMDDSQQDFVRPINCGECDNDFLCIKNCSGFWRQHAVEQCLKTSFKISRATILFLHDYITKETFKKCHDQRFNIYQEVVVSSNMHKFDWPCVPRRKAIAVTEISHIIKNYSLYSDLNVMSWSSNGNMAASFGEDLVLWTPKGKSLLTYEMKGITCLAYSYDGKYLAVGIKLESDVSPEIQIWDVSNESIGVFITSYKYNDFEDEVRCVLWHPQNSSLVSGMLSGDVNVHTLSSSLKKVESLTCSKFAVKMLQFSSNQEFLAATDESGKVFVWNSKTFEIVFQWNEKDKHKVLIAWHPWKESYLIISSRLPASISLFDIRTNSMIAYYNRTDEICRIDAITFNPKSAELVVSVTVYDGNSATYEIVVLAALDRVVDLLNIHDGCVKCLLWNADGTMLATGGDDNMLNIWNFFGYSQLQPVKSKPKEKYVHSKFMLGNPSMLR